MREIKFRAWDKNNKKMFYGDSGFEFESDGCVYINIIQADFRADKEPILMQFTGLHDKNGKEIYEGDICYYWPEANRQTFQVAYIGSCFRGINKDLMYGRIEDYAAAGLEVIGNIHENPELIAP